MRRSNKRAVAEAGGVQVVLDLIGSGDTDTLIQATMFINLLFSNKTIQEYASSETVRAITECYIAFNLSPSADLSSLIAAAIEKDLWATGTVHEEYLKALNELFGNFPRLRASEPATLSIPHLVTSLKTGSEATQEAALDALFIMRLAWSACPADVSRSQSNLRIIFTPYETTEVTLPSFLLATSLPKKSIKELLGADNKICPEKENALVLSYEEIQMMHIPPPYVSCVVGHYEHYLSTKFPFGSYTQVFIDPEMAVSSLSLGASMSIFSSQILYEEKIIDQVESRLKETTSRLEQQLAE
uniref:Uncharacterized protein n=1 Tax=Lactuca sativa TaxID=4236 RepID=A0A9R1VQU3_LACSA|nr:hypothetical protein LSAT_V11C400217850 [Lactuca sativa]